MLTRRMLFLCFVVILPACGRSPSTETSPNGNGPSPPAVVQDQAEAEVETLLEPFDPPPLEELEASVEWVDQRVADPRAALRELQAAEPRLATVEEVLRSRNDSPEANQKIIGTLGRLPDSEREVDWDATMVRRIGGDVKSTNPVMHSSVFEGDASSLIGVEFFGFDWNMEAWALADSVESWQTSGDRLYDKMVIRDDLTWSDGVPITAHDIAFSLQTIMNPRVPVPAVRTGTDQIKWVHAYDDQTVVYFHKEATPMNIWNINFPVIPKHIYEKSVEEDPTMQNSDYHVKLEENPVTGGPYVLAKRVRGQELVFQRRESYFSHDGEQVRPMRHFEEVRFRVIQDPNTALLALRSGEVEDIELTAEQWVTEQTNNEEFYGRNTKGTALEWAAFHFNWNCATPFFSDKRVRWAMSYAFDHEEMLNKIFYGLYTPAAGPFHKTSWMAPENYPAPLKQDLDKAESLLDEAGWNDSNGDGIRDKEIGGKPVNFEFSIICYQTPAATKVTELMSQCLDQIGIVCHVKPTEFTVVIDMVTNHKFQAAFGGWSTGVDPFTNINIFGTGEDRNSGLYSNPEVDELFKRGREEFDREKRAAIYGRIHEILFEDQPYTWLFWRNSFYGFNKELRGYKFSPRGPYSYNPGFAAIWKSAAR